MPPMLVTFFMFVLSFDCLSTMALKPKPKQKDVVMVRITRLVLFI